MKYLSSVIWVILSLVMPLDAADANLVIAPKRVVFTGNKRVADILLVNKSPTAGTYRLSFVNKRIKMDGRIEDITSPTSPTGEQFANSMLRFSPRQVRLKPGESQTVRVLLRKPPSLAPGEYRSHLQLTHIPEAEKPSRAAAKKKVSIQLGVVYSLSLPIIVRQGKTSASVAITAAQFVPDPKAPGSGHLKVRLKRTGNQSTYGPLRAVYKRLKEPGEIEVGLITNVTIHMPGDEREIELPLAFPKGSRAPKGSISLTYTDGEPNSGGTIFATKIIELP